MNLFEGLDLMGWILDENMRPHIIKAIDSYVNKAGEAFQGLTPDQIWRRLTTESKLLILFRLSFEGVGIEVGAANSGDNNEKE